MINTVIPHTFGDNPFDIYGEDKTNIPKFSDFVIKEATSKPCSYGGSGALAKPKEKFDDIDMLDSKSEFECETPGTSSLMATTAPVISAGGNKKKHINAIPSVTNILLPLDPFFSIAVIQNAFDKIQDYYNMMYGGLRIVVYYNSNLLSELYNGKCIDLTDAMIYIALNDDGKTC
jgi:hypothetical protein